MIDSAEFDAVVVGAGAAGIGAGRALADTGCRFAIVEARDRVGGRAWTIDSGEGYPIDIGCEWLHSAPRNPLVAVARSLGQAVDEYPHIWADEWNTEKLGEATYAEFRGTVNGLFEQAEALARKGGPDVAFGQLLPAETRWRAATDAICGWITGGRLDQVSAVDMGRMDDLQVNWRLPGGYGTVIAALAEGLPLSLSTPVTRIDWQGKSITVETPHGCLRARRVIVTLPTDVIAAGAVDFAPALPADKLQAVADLPLGADLKLFLAVEGTPFGPPRDRQLPSRYDRVDCGFIHLHPFGRPMATVYFGGDIARELEAAGLAAMADFAEQELAFNFGAAVRGSLRPLAASSWMSDPLAGGAYAYARPGALGARAALAAALDERLFFAGEATSPDEFATAHGAYVTGYAAGQAAAAARVAI